MRLGEPVLLSLLLIVALLPSSTAPAGAADAAGQVGAGSFYAGKTVKFLVGFERGVAYDLYARLTAEHLGRHIPGKPDIVVENNPEAGTRAAERLYRDVAPDGATIAALIPALYLQQLIGNAGGRFDFARFTWIGSPTKSPYLLYVRSDGPYKTMKDARDSSVAATCGSVDQETTPYFLPKLVEQTLGGKFKVVTGFLRVPDVDLAVETGQLQCRALTIDSFFSYEPHPSWLRSGFIRVLLQTGARRDPRLAGVPTLSELMDEFKTPDSSRGLAQLVLASSEFGRPIAGPPGIPPDRAKALRDAFSSAMKDPALVAQAKMENLDLNPASGQELEALAREVVAQPRDVVERMKKLLGK